jgi:hypothetical protein
MLQLAWQLAPPTGPKGATLLGREGPAPFQLPAATAVGCTCRPSARSAAPLPAQLPRIPFSSGNTVDKAFIIKNQLFAILLTSWL